eukprot:4300897-Lingulodinium_polyedra.AAC.1
MRSCCPWVAAKLAEPLGETSSNSPELIPVPRVAHLLPLVLPRLPHRLQHGTRRRRTGLV